MKNRRRRTFDASNKIEMIVSSREFVDIVENNRNSLISSKFIFPKLGDNHFGKFKVVLKRNNYSLVN